MCHHPASNIIRTRILKKDGKAKAVGSGTVRTIEYVTEAYDGETCYYQGTYVSGEVWHITRDKVRTHPKIFRLRKNLGHRNCYQLVITLAEKYLKLSGIRPLLGPMQRDLKGLPKTEYRFSNGKTVTDQALNEDKDVSVFCVVDAYVGNNANQRFLRETCSEAITERVIKENLEE